MANAIVAPSIEFYGLKLNGIDPIAEDLRDYLEAHGVKVIQQDGHIAIYGNYSVDPKDLRQRFPQYFDKYIINSYTVHSFDKEPGILYYHATSISKSDHKLKYWLEKDITQQYNISQAAQDVTRATICKQIFGDKFTSKLKFDVSNLGVVTRTIYSDLDEINIHTLCGILELMVAGSIDFKKEVQLRVCLLNLILIGLLTENRRLSVFEMGCEVESLSEGLKDLENPLIKNVFPFKFWNFPESVVKNSEVMAFADLLPLALKDFSVVFDIIMSDKLHWNYADVENFIAIKHYEKILVAQQLLTAQLSQDDFNNALKNVLEAINNDDYELCNNVRNTIYDHLRTPHSNFTNSEIEQNLMPDVDKVLATLKINSKLAYECLLNLEAKNNTELKATLAFTP